MTPPMDLATACAEMHGLMLDDPDVVDFLQRLAELASSLVPGTHCGITLRRDREVATVASSDDTARRMDEAQYLRGDGPCLEAMRKAARVDVRDMDQEERWGDYRAHALANGIRSVLSLPLVVDHESIGALNLFGCSVGAFGERDVARVQAFTEQAATALTLLLRQVDRISLDDQLREALSFRAVIDQAIGIVACTQKVGAHQAFEILRHASQTSNRKSARSPPRSSSP